MAEKKKFAVQNHIDLSKLEKPRFNPSDFGEYALVTKTGRLKSINGAIGVLAEESKFLKNFATEGAVLRYTSTRNVEFDEYVFVYIHQLGIYGFLKKSSLVFMLTKLLFDLKLDTKATKLPESNKKQYEKNISGIFTLKQINDYLNKPSNNFSYLYEYAYEIVYSLGVEHSSQNVIDPCVYRFRNSVQKHVIYDDNHPSDYFYSLFYFDIDYIDDLILMSPCHYEAIYINTDDYWYMPFEITDEDGDMLEALRKI